MMMPVEIEFLGGGNSVPFVASVTLDDNTFLCGAAVTEREAVARLKEKIAQHRAAAKPWIKIVELDL